MAMQREIKLAGQERLNRSEHT